MPLFSERPEQALSDPADVAEWLSEFPPDAVVGTTGDSLDCVLHNYLVARTDRAGEKVRVGLCSYSIEDKAYPLPLWAQGFVHLHDSYKQSISATAHPVTAWTASIILQAMRNWFSTPPESRPPTITAIGFDFMAPSAFSLSPNVSPMTDAVKSGALEWVAQL